MMRLSCEVVDSEECGVGEGTRWAAVTINPTAGLDGLLRQLQQKIPSPDHELTDVLVFDEDFEEWLVLQELGELQDRQDALVKIKLMTSDRTFNQRLTASRIEAQQTAAASARATSPPVQERSLADAAPKTMAKLQAVDAQTKAEALALFCHRPAKTCSPNYWIDYDWSILSHIVLYG
eukprot:SAG22_NODE_1454_length_4388_cov_65.736302_3_plen_178_part_00